MRTVCALLLSAAAAWGQSFLRVDTGLLCGSESVRATVVWQAPVEGVQVRVGGANGTPLTGFEGASGQAETGDWVKVGMTFFLVDRTGRVWAQASAYANCAGDDELAGGLAKLGWFPLQPGNRWVYQYNSRASATTYFVREVGQPQLIEGRTYFPLGGILYRTDDQGRVWTRTNGQDKLYLDPTTPQDPNATYQVMQRTDTYNSPFGRFPGMLTYGGPPNLAFETGVIVRGLGLVETTTTLRTGSSGGFVEGATLVEARVAGRTYRATTDPAVRLSVENRRLAVSTKKVTNCVVPCYFVACFLAPGTDAPDTYKPCFRAQVETEGIDGDVEVTFGAFKTTVRGYGAVQLPLYTKPNEPLPAGEYRVRATAQGVTAEIPVTVE